MKRHLILLYLLAISVAVIAARVEYLNAAAGHYLPRNHLQDVGKWRTTFLDEERWRRYFGPRDDSGEPVVRELTAHEWRQMQSDIAQIDSKDRLRDWIRSAGLLQYLLLPVLTLATLASMATHPTRRRIAHLAPIATVIFFAFVSLWRREYFSSLGW